MTWNLDGKSITIDFNNGFMVLSGEINSNFDSMQGLMGHSNFKTTERYLKYDKNMFVDLVNNDEKLITSNETFLS